MVNRQRYFKLSLFLAHSSKIATSSSSYLEILLKLLLHERVQTNWSKYAQTIDKSFPNSLTAFIRHSWFFLFYHIYWIIISLDIKWFIIFSSVISHMTKIMDLTSPGYSDRRFQLLRHSGWHGRTRQLLFSFNFACKFNPTAIFTEKLIDTNRSRRDENFIYALKIKIQSKVANK